ncbi:hypothetical protein ACFL54_00405 [Planctomycetota bacterium]
MIIFYCNNCEKELKTELYNCGKIARCPRCKAKTKIPDDAILLEDDRQKVGKLTG